MLSLFPEWNQNVHVSNGMGDKSFSCVGNLPLDSPKATLSEWISPGGWRSSAVMGDLCWDKEMVVGEAEEAEWGEARKGASMEETRGNLCLLTSEDNIA